MENDAETHTRTRRCGGETEDKTPTQRGDMQEVVDRREARINRKRLRTERQHGESHSQADGGAFKTCWPFTRVDGKQLEAAHRKERQGQIEEVGEALL